MAISTSQQIARYYQQYSDVDVTFTKDVIKATLLYPKQVYLKCTGHQWPIVVYSASMTGAKIIANMKTALSEALKKSNSMVSLRLSFLQRDKADPLSFFVGARVAGYTPYGKEKPELYFLTLTYTQRPPDDLIEILGRLIDANTSSTRRKDERIPVTADSARAMGLNHKDAMVYIEGVPRRCIVRDVSFGGAKVVILGVAKFLLNKQAHLRLMLTETDEEVDIPATVVRFETVEGRSDIAALALQFDTEAVPMKYKLMISGFLNSSKARTLRNQEARDETENGQHTE
ncbi:MAG: PilZN3 domain-containing protein [Spirochaetaceae bacterium]